MSNKGKSHNKKWLISRLKTSGSKRKHVVDGDYADTRNSKKNQSWEDLPSHEGMGKSFKFFNSKVNYGLLVRFLRGKAGSDWNEVSQEIEDRIPTDLSEYKECVHWFVSDLIEKHEDGLWDKREQKYLKLDPNEPFDWNLNTCKEFYVDPETNQLVRIKDFPSNRKTKGMDSDQLREFRENEQRVKLEEKKAKKLEQIEANIKAEEMLSNTKEQDV